MGRKPKTPARLPQAGSCGGCYLWDVAADGRTPLRECLERRNAVTRPTGVWRLMTGPSDTCEFYVSPDAVGAFDKRGEG